MLTPNPLQDPAGLLVPEKGIVHTEHSGRRIHEAATADVLRGQDAPYHRVLPVNGDGRAGRSG